MSLHHVGIIGFGTEGVWHAHQVEISEVFELVGVSDISESRKLFAQEKGYKFYNSNKALLSDPEIDIVIIATRTAVIMNCPLKRSRQENTLFVKSLRQETARNLRR